MSRSAAQHRPVSVTRNSLQTPQIAPMDTAPDVTASDAHHKATNHNLTKLTLHGIVRPLKSRLEPGGVDKAANHILNPKVGGWVQDDCKAERCQAYMRQTNFASRACVFVKQLRGLVFQFGSCLASEFPRSST